MKKMYFKMSQVKSSIQGFPISQWQSPKGFTLVELLVSVAIIVTMSAFGIASFNGASQKSAVKSQAQELKTLIRKLRTDAGAALKPTGGCQTDGVVYGTYITFVWNTDYVTYGVYCFRESDDFPYISATNLKLKSPMLQGSQFNPNTTVYFSFNGEVKIFSTIPAILTDLSGPSLVNFVRVIIGDGGNFATGNTRQIAINRNGLVCDETTQGANISPCAQ